MWKKNYFLSSPKNVKLFGFIFYSYVEYDETNPLPLSYFQWNLYFLKYAWKYFVQRHVIPLKYTAIDFVAYNLQLINVKKKKK